MSHTSPSTTTDFYGVFSDISEADARAWARAREFAQSIESEINDYWERAEFPEHFARKIGEYDLFTDGLKVDGTDTMSPLGAGLVNMEVARADGSMATVIAVNGGLALRSIMTLGSDEQIERYAQPMARGELFGAFALTEPDHGSDAVALETSARREGDEWVLNGQKRWIGLGAHGDISVVYARMEDGNVSGFIVPQDTPGYSAETITGKISLRAVPQALITLEDVRVPESNRLPKAGNFKDVSEVLKATRCSVAWMALGLATACVEKATEFVSERTQFSKPLARFQIIQQRLADMQQQLVSMQLYCRRIAELDAAGELRLEQASLAKVHNTRGARAIAANARDMLGGSGILLENHIARHFADVEALHTYEGTDTIQSLIVGRAMTGVSAFA